MSGFAGLLAAREAALTEGSIYERLRRDPRVRFDPQLCHGALIYSQPEALAAAHGVYVEVAKQAGLPILIFTDTWRATAERIAASDFAGRAVNEDNAAFLKKLAAASGHLVFVGGLTGCRGDAYRPQEALDADTAERFHRPQIEALAPGVDFLFAATLPAASEALGIAKAMAATGVPFLISFVIRGNGALLDGTLLSEAIERIDATAPPAAYAINCVHPSAFLEGMRKLEDRPDILRRLACFQANASACDPDELNDCATLLSDEPAGLARGIAAARNHGLFILGGCCGTDERHIAALAGELLRKQI